MQTPDREQAARLFQTAPILTFAEAAAACGIAVSSFDKLVREGAGPVVIKIGKNRYVKPADLSAWIDAVSA